MSNNTFYMVYLEWQHTPAHKHNTLYEAENEAKRLTKIHNKKSYVLEAKKSFNLIEFIEEDLWSSVINFWDVTLQINNPEDIPF